MNMMMKKTAVAVALGLALGLTACGGGGGGGSTSSSGGGGTTNPGAQQDVCNNIDGIQTYPLPYAVKYSPSTPDRIEAIPDGAYNTTCTSWGVDPKMAAFFKAHNKNPQNWKFLDLINAEYAYERGAKGAGVAIVVSDNGIWQNHVELQGKVIEAYGVPAQWGYYNPYAHGTGVASAAAGYTVGVAPESALTDQASNGYRVTDTTNSKATVLNFSTGYVEGTLNVFDNPQSRSNFLKNDMVMIKASGNEGITMDEAYPYMNNNPGYPMFDPDTKNRLIIAGGRSAFDPDNPIYEHPGENVAYQQVFITSPVCGINVADYDPNDPTKLSTICGTSIATPTVSAVVAIVRGMYPSLSSEKVVKAVLLGANKSFTNLYADNTCGKSKTANCGWYYFGHGLLDVKGALQQAEKML